MLSIGLLFSTAGCSTNKIDEEALQEFGDSIVALSNLKSMELKIDFDTTVQETTTKGSLHGPIIVNGLDSKAALSVDIEASGQSVKDVISIYFTDQIVYFKMMGMKYKVPLTTQLGDLSSTDIFEDNTTFNMEAMKPFLTSVKREDNKIVIEFNADKINEQMTNTGDNKLKSLIIKANVDAGQFKGADIIAETDGKEAQTVNMSLVLEKIDAVDNVDFPDFSDYTETTALQ